MTDNSPAASSLQQHQQIANESPRTSQLQRLAERVAVTRPTPVQVKTVIARAEDGDLLQGITQRQIIQREGWDSRGGAAIKYGVLGTALGASGGLAVAAVGGGIGAAFGYLSG
jgi:hypothetical protein